MPEISCAILFVVAAADDVVVVVVVVVGFSIYLVLFDLFQVAVSRLLLLGH